MLGAVAPSLARAEKAPVEAPALSGEAALRVARAMRASGDPGASLQIYRDMTAQLPPQAPLRIEYADALLEANLIDEAIGVYSLAPANASAQLGLAKAQLALHQPTRALPLAERAVAIAPRDVGALIVRGVVLDRLGKHAEAQASYRAALAEAPRNIAARTNMSLSLALSGRCDEALEILGADRPLRHGHPKGSPEPRLHLWP